MNESRYARSTISRKDIYWSSHPNSCKSVNIIYTRSKYTKYPSFIRSLRSMEILAGASPAETLDFVPLSEWPTLEELAKGYSEHLMATSDKLTGLCITLIIDGQLKVSHKFLDATRLVWHVLEGHDQSGLSSIAEYAAFEVRHGIFFVDFFKPDYDEHVSIVLKPSTGQAAVAISGFRIDKDSKRTWTKLCGAVIEGHDAVEPFPVTDELIGKHIMYRYTPRDVYEHVYLNRGTLTWHCLSGTEKGLADTERCRVLKLDEKLYLLFWTETIMPVESIVVVDLKGLRSTGRFFCWDPKPQQPVRMRFGSYATILAETTPSKTLANL